MEPMSVGYHSLEVGGFRSGHVAVVAGAGPIGLATIECLKALGAEKIIVVQRKSVRQEYALRAGADILLEPGKDDVVAEIYRLTGGAGADIAFETTGSEQCLLLLLESIKAAGTLVVTSIWEGPVTLARISCFLDWVIFASFPYLLSLRLTVCDLGCSDFFCNDSFRSRSARIRLSM